MKKFLFILILLSSFNLFAQEDSVHKEEGVTTGVITGTLLENGKTPLPGQMVTLEIFRGHELILDIPKKTDANGGYSFKNIFQSPEFLYAVSAEYRGKVFRTDLVSLAAGEAVKRLDLKVGEGVETGPEMPMPPQTMRFESPSDGGTQPAVSGEYKLLAIILSIAVIIFALYQRKRF